MLYSMTGFGKAQANIEDILVQVEIRTLNSKGLDTNVRLPMALKHKEVEIRNLFSQELKRGKIDAYFTLDLPASLQVNVIDQDVFSAYLEQLEPVMEKYSLDRSGMLHTVLHLPNVLTTPEQDLDEVVWEEIKLVVKDACEKVNAFRLKEGGTMEVELQHAIDEIAKNLKLIPQYEQERVDKVKERMEAGLTALSEQIEVDQNRLEQELIFYIEKFDITEEKVRLAAHLDHFLEYLKNEQEVAKGKKLNFISQEIGREINTIGSKANHVEIQKLVVDMKDQLEQIKEQLSNIL